MAVMFRLLPILMLTGRVLAQATSPAPAVPYDVNKFSRDQILVVELCRRCDAVGLRAIEAEWAESDSEAHALLMEKICTFLQNNRVDAQAAKYDIIQWAAKSGLQRSKKLPLGSELFLAANLVVSPAVEGLGTRLSEAEQVDVRKEYTRLWLKALGRLSEVMIPLEQADTGPIEWDSSVPSKPYDRVAVEKGRLRLELQKGTLLAERYYPHFKAYLIYNYPDIDDTKLRALLTSADLSPAVVQHLFAAMSGWVRVGKGSGNPVGTRPSTGGLRTPP